MDGKHYERKKSLSAAAAGFVVGAASGMFT